jgi:hypothetical protein
MRLVITFLSKKQFTIRDISQSLVIIERYFKVPNEHYLFTYPDFYELDIDLFGIDFTRETINDDLLQVINVCETILSKVRDNIEFIIADSDTNTFVNDYEKDKDNISRIGLFITTRYISDIEPFYSSNKCNAYVNLASTSFDLYDNWFDEHSDVWSEDYHKKDINNIIISMDKIDQVCKEFDAFIELQNNSIKIIDNMYTNDLYLNNIASKLNNVVKGNNTSFVINDDITISRVGSSYNLIISDKKYNNGMIVNNPTDIQRSDYYDFKITMKFTYDELKLLIDLIYQFTSYKIDYFTLKKGLYKKRFITKANSTAKDNIILNLKEKNNDMWLLNIMCITYNVTTKQNIWVRNKDLFNFAESLKEIFDLMIKKVLFVFEDENSSLILNIVTTLTGSIKILVNFESKDNITDNMATFFVVVELNDLNSFSNEIMNILSNQTTTATLSKFNY